MHPSQTKNTLNHSENPKNSVEIGAKLYDKQRQSDEGKP